MQAVYSTTTDVKIHKAIRREWASFHTWLLDQRRRLEYRENEILSAAHRKRGKMKQPDKQQILGLHEEFLAVARGEWLARVRQSQLHLEHWVMTPDEKQMLQQTLGWTQTEMVDAYAREQAEMGPMYQRVDPVSLGTKEPPMPSTSRFMHPHVTADTPAYAKWASELAKLPAASPRKPPKSIKSLELPAMPLYFVGALLQGTDLDAVAASDLESFALHASEEKIREYYALACDATLHFQRLLPTLDQSKREEAQEGFERHMRDLASVKEREWKAITVKELRRHQAVEMERRVAQQRAMRPSPAPKEFRREFHDWDYVDDYDNPFQDYQSYASPHTDYLQEYRSPRQEYRSPREDFRTPRPDYRETYQSPLLSSIETYRSPRRIKRRHVPDEEYARGGTVPFSTNHVRTARPLAAAPNWSSVRVDEVDLKSRSATSPKQHPRNANGFLLRLDTTDKPKPPSREKLKKRRSENLKAPPKGPAEPAAPGARVGGAGRVFGRRVPDPERKISMEEEALIRTGKTGEEKSQSDQLRLRLGGGLGLGNDQLYKRFYVDQKRDAVGNEARIPSRQHNLSHALKRVRFTSSAVFAGGSGNLKRPLPAASQKLNTESKFYEGFDSKVNSAAS
ncbi:hypothetical protein DFH09DRAFT_1140104 [Mycena vulgaris]|nr:hypothetical protein DFH09DRAFT_1140104 [Mycena vulgaris]